MSVAPPEGILSVGNNIKRRRPYFDPSTQKYSVARNELLIAETNYEWV